MLQRIGSMLFVLACFFPLRAQDSDELLQRAIAHIRDTVNRLPNYLCTQTMERFESAIGERYFGCSWWPPPDRFRNARSDRVRVDVLSTARGEMYSWPGENQFQKDLLQLVRLRPLSTGGFSGYLGSIFGGSASVFSYRREIEENGRKLREYEFRVPREKSSYLFGSDADRRIIAFEGTFLLDPETADLVRLVVKSSELPQFTGACQATTTLNYGRTSLNNSEFLLPTRSLFELIGTHGEEVRNSSVYSNCHEFRGESTLRFDVPEPGRYSSATASGRPLRALPVLTLPEGRPFRIVFAQDIEFRTAAAGDTIAAKLATPIVDASKHVLVPAGTPVAVRILFADVSRRIPLAAGIVAGAHLIFRLESLTMAGTEYSFVATISQAIESSDPTDHDWGSPVNHTVLDLYVRDKDLGPLLLAPNVGLFKFFGIQTNFVLKAGKESKWKTGGTGATPDCLSGNGYCK